MAYEQEAGPPTAGGAPSEPTGQHYTKEDVAWGQYWGRDLVASKKWMEKFWEQGTKIEKRYLGKTTQTNTLEEATAAFNVFWSNTQVILSAIFSRQPKPEINRSNLDPNDDAARVAATIMKRIFEAQFRLPDTSPMIAFQSAVQDRFAMRSS